MENHSLTLFPSKFGSGGRFAVMSRAAMTITPSAPIASQTRFRCWVTNGVLQNGSFPNDPQQRLRATDVICKHGERARSAACGGYAINLSLRKYSLQSAVSRTKESIASFLRGRFVTTYNLQA